MSSTAFSAILAAGFSSVIGLIGGFLLLAKYEGVKRWSKFFVSFAAGALIGAAFFDILAEAIGEYGNRIPTLFGWVMTGFFLLFIVERIVLAHHHGDEELSQHSHAHLIPMNIIGDAVHNFVDGSIIAATFLTSPGLGVATALAVFFHEIPREIGDFSIMIYAGMSRRGVVWWNILGALVSPFAAVLTVLVAQRVQSLELPLLGIAAGNFIYIAATDLVPEIHQQKSGRAFAAQFLLLLLGVLAMVWISQQFAG